MKEKKVKKAYRMFKRNGVFYLHDNRTGSRTSLHTKGKEEAEKLLNAKNEALNEPLLNLARGKAYLTAIDPEVTTRTWRHVFNLLAQRCKRQTTHERWLRAMRSKPFARLLDTVNTGSRDVRALAC